MNVSSTSGLAVSAHNTYIDNDIMDSAKVKSQIEYYFGVANLRKDKWLKEEAAKHAEGFVELQKVCNFPMMKSLGATDVAEVAKVLKDSEVVMLSEDGTLIKVTPHQ